MASKDSKVCPAGNAYAGAGLSDCIKSGNLAAGKIIDGVRSQPLLVSAI